MSYYNFEAIADQCVTAGKWMAIEFSGDELAFWKKIQENA